MKAYRQMANPKDYQSTFIKSLVDKSAALSMENTIKNTIKSRKIACIAADGVNGKNVKDMKAALEKEGAVMEVIAPHVGTIEDQEGNLIEAKKSFLNAASVMYDAVYIPGGTQSVGTFADDGDIIHFLNEAYKHCKPIAGNNDAMQVIENTAFAKAIKAG
jgi:catalase